MNGKVVITHQSNIQVPGWSGAGYLILDPDLMDGSYKISGGGNGGWYTLLTVAVFHILGIVAVPSLLLGGLVAPIFIGALGALALGMLIGTLLLGADFETYEQEIDVIEFIARTLALSLVLSLASFTGASLLPFFLVWLLFVSTGSIFVYKFA